MIIITGMHRSGTSFAAHMLHSLGLDFGPLDSLAPADEWNPKGYFESIRLQVLHDYIVMGAAAPGHYYRMTPDKSRSQLLETWMSLVRYQYMLPFGYAPLERRAHDRQDDMLSLAANADRAYKDPRFCLTLGIWSRATAIQKVLLLYRSPEEVAASLQSRYGLPMWIGLHLWKVHTISFFRQVNNIPLVIANFERFFGDDALVETSRLYAFAERKFNRKEAQGLISSVLSPHLKRNHRTHYKLPSDIKQLFDQIEQWRENHHDLTLFQGDIERAIRS